MERHIEITGQPQQCTLVERYLNEKITDVVKSVEAIRDDVDGHVNKLYEEIHEARTGLSNQLEAHAKDDREAIRNIEVQLLTRVPPWALLVMTVSGSMIGAMATYILDHLKH